MLHFASYSGFPYLTYMYLPPPSPWQIIFSKIKQNCNEEWNSPEYLDREYKN